MVPIPPRGEDRQAAQGEDEAANLEIRDDRQGIANPEQTGSNVIVTLREHVDNFFGPIRDSVAPEVVTVIASTARLGVGVADSFITRSIPLASVTVGTALVGIADDILSHLTNLSFVGGRSLVTRWSQRAIISRNGR